MSDLHAALARMLDDQVFWSEDHTDPEADAASMLATDEGQALAALVEAAVAWRRATFGDLQPSLRALGEAVERWESLADD